MNLKQLVDRHNNQRPPEGHTLRVIVGLDFVRAEYHPGWNDDGEEKGDPVYLNLAESYPSDVLCEALSLLGLPVERS